MLSAVHPLGYALYVALNAEEVAELGGKNQKIEQLVTRNAVLERENEEYSGVYYSLFCLCACCAVGDAVSGLHPSEKVADMRHKIEAMEAKLAKRHSVIMQLHGVSMYVCMCVCVCVCVCLCVCTYFNIIVCTLKHGRRNLNCP